MVDRSNLAKAVALSNEYANIAQAITNLDNGGRITAMVVSPPSSETQPGKTASVRTDYISYPQTMVDTIKQGLSYQQQEIGNELASMGVT